MAIVINGSGTITGVSAGGLPDGSVDSDTLATGIDAIKLADGTVTNSELQYINSLSSNAQTQISGVGGGKVLQVLQTVESDIATTTSTSMADMGLSIAITPAATSSKILVSAVVHISSETSSNVSFVQLVRTTTAIGIGDAASSRIRSSTCTMSYNDTDLIGTMIDYLDSPGVDVATTYKLQWMVSNGGANLNHSQADDDNVHQARTISTIRVMEIGA